MNRDRRREQRLALFLTHIVVTAACVFTVSPASSEEPAGEAAGAGRLTREQEAPIRHLCAGCLAPIFTDGSRGSVTPYGRVELDAIYSNRNTNPLDPAQFNGYATAAGSNNNGTSTLNPRYSVFGIRADRTDGKHSLKGVVEADFYGERDVASSILPRLRLANVSYSVNRFTIVAGQDWTPVMALHPDLIDFSILGYGGNLWQRIPQITVRYRFTENFDALLTVMRFERGLYAISGQRQVRPSSGPRTAQGNAPAPNNSDDAFSDPVLHPYYGTRLAYTGTGRLDGVLVAVSAAYRYYRSAPIPGGATGFGSSGFTPGRDINSYLVGAELVVPITQTLKFSGELAYGQALGQEFFRFGQDLNLTTGKPVRTWLGWGQLSWAAAREYTVLAGAGWDNPYDSDLRGSTVNVDTQYLNNYRTYLTVVHPIWADFHVGFEWQHLWTTWVVGNGSQSFQGDMYNMSLWYNF
ncbi:hypothetical protein [Candidatus Nitrospira bockiana]